MIRLLLRLLGIDDFEICKSCETLKQQLEYERSEKKQLTETLLNIVSPKTIESAPVILNPVAQSAGLFSRRRAALEEKDRQEARILAEAKHIGKPDDALQVVNDDAKKIEALEDELGIALEREA